jgi:hypothetical protein
LAGRGNVQESPFPRWSARGRADSIAGRKSLALKRIVVFAILLDNTNRLPVEQQLFAFA